jgi:hypothetical protein
MKGKINWLSQAVSLALALVMIIGGLQPLQTLAEENTELSTRSLGTSLSGRNLAVRSENIVTVDIKDGIIASYDDYISDAYGNVIATDISADNDILRLTGVTNLKVRIQGFKTVIIDNISIDGGVSNETFNIAAMFLRIENLVVEGYNKIHSSGAQPCLNMQTNSPTIISGSGTLELKNKDIEVNGGQGILGNIDIRDDVKILMDVYEGIVCNDLIVGDRSIINMTAREDGIRHTYTTSNGGQLIIRDQANVFIDSHRYGIITNNGNLDIRGGKLKINSDDYAISASHTHTPESGGSLLISGGIIDLYGEVFGVAVDNITMTAGSVYINSSFSSIHIGDSDHGGIDITGGHLIAESSDASSSVSCNKIVISGANTFVRFNNNSTNSISSTVYFDDNNTLAVNSGGILQLDKKTSGAEINKLFYDCYIIGEGAVQQDIDGYYDVNGVRHEIPDDFVPPNPDKPDEPINPTNVKPYITNGAVAPTTVGYTYSYLLTANGTTPISWSIVNGALPDGLSMSVDGNISGVATKAGTYGFTVLASNAFGSDSRDFNLIVSQGTSVNHDQVISAYLNYVNSFAKMDKAQVNNRLKETDKSLSLCSGAWCASFLAETSAAFFRTPNIIPHNITCSIMYDNIKSQGGIDTTNPQKGDIIFFDWGINGVFEKNSHVGIVYNVGSDAKGRYIDAVHGNFHNIVCAPNCTECTARYYLSLNSYTNGLQLKNIWGTIFADVKYVSPDYGRIDENLNGTMVATFKCPVDVNISFNGETLNSATDSTITSWGTMLIIDDEIVATLDYGNSYSIIVTGTGEGSMDLQIEYNTNTGQNVRSFLNIPIKPSTTAHVYTNTADCGTELFVDDNDTSIIWYAEPGETVTEGDEGLTDSFIGQDGFDFNDSDDGLPNTPRFPIADSPNNDNGSSFISENYGISNIAATVNTVYWIGTDEAKTLVNSAKHDGLDYVRTRRITSTGIRKAALSALIGLRYEHDTLLNKAVQVRLSIPDPAKATKDLLVSGHVTGTAVNKVKALFEKWYANKIRVIHLEQQGGWDQPVNISAKVDLTGMDTKNLYFYSYDQKSNVYKRITAPAYWIDANGYIHFTTEFAGDIVISENLLVKR